MIRSYCLLARLHYVFHPLFNVEIGHYHYRAEIMTQDKSSPIHPGEVLLEEFLKPRGISQYQLAKDISVPARRINEIVHGKRAVSADTALRLARYFSLSERFWLNLQARYDLEVEKDRLAHRLEDEVKVFTAAPHRPPPAA
jgi:addiction module HigA family antidote